MYQMSKEPTQCYSRMRLLEVLWKTWKASGWWFITAKYSSTYFCNSQFNFPFSTIIYQLLHKGSQRRLKGSQRVYCHLEPWTRIIDYWLLIITQSFTENHRVTQRVLRKTRVWLKCQFEWFSMSETKRKLYREQLLELYDFSILILIT